MRQTDIDALRRLARKYVWWKTPEEAVAMPRRVIAQVMNIGDYSEFRKWPINSAMTCCATSSIAQKPASSMRDHGPIGTTA